MFSSQLFFFVAIALISEHLQAQPSTTPSPDAWKPYAKRALRFIESSIPTVQTFTGAPGNGSLLEAEQLVVDALNKTDHNEIRGDLQWAMHSEEKALRELEVACPTLGAKTGSCNIVCAAIKLSKKELFDAIWKLL